MAGKISILPLNELYTKKITASVEAAIQSKEDFSKISKDYCSTVCRLKCKNPGKVQLLNEEVDILIIQDHAAPKGKFDRTDTGQEVIQRNIIEFVCQQAGFSGLTYRVVNLLKCAPNEQDFPKGKSPTVITLQKCKPYLLAEIERAKPKAILSLSTAVTKALGYSKHSNTGNRGEIVNGNTVITLHPRVLTMIRQNASGAMWGNDYLNIIKRDFEKAARIARGQLTIKDINEALAEQKKNIKICRSLDDVRDMVQTICELPGNKLVSVDTETTGLDGMADGAKLLTIQFGWKNEKGVYVASVVPLWHRENKAYDADTAWSLIVPILLSKEIKKILHNAKFDILYIYHTTGVRMEGVEFDTMLMMHALDSGIQGCLSLKTAVWDHMPELGIGGYEDLLPKLTKGKALAAEEDEDESE